MNDRPVPLPRLFLVDDPPAVREGLPLLLEAPGATGMGALRRRAAADRLPP